MNKKNQIVGTIMMFLCALIWGLAFVAQSKGAEIIPPMWFTVFRNILAVITLLPVIFFIDRSKKKKGTFKKIETKKEKRFFWIGAVLCGLALCVASYLQQLGLTLGTEPGKAGFITALYIIIVPIFSIVLKKKVRLIIWFCVVLSTIGLYLLCVSGSGEIRKSDFVVFLCAILYSVQIMLIDYISPHFDGVKLSAAQFLFCAIFAFFAALFMEKITWQNIVDGIIPLLYAGIFSSGVAFTLQTVSQKKMNNPTLSSLIMSFESVFSVMFSAIILSQIPTLKEGLGCVIMFVSVILAQLPARKKSSD